MNSKPTQWLELHARTTATHIESLEHLLLDAGAISITLKDDADQPLLEPGVGETPLWDSVHLNALFPTNYDNSTLADALEQQFGAALNFSFRYLAEQDWERTCLDQFTAQQFGRSLWICPSWAEPPDPSATNIMLDPGLAFGTGTHPTTRLCLEWLAEATLKDRIVVDYGCGSGILAIAALMLGARLAVCIDNDPQALIATRQNAEANRLAADSIITAMPDQVSTELEQLQAQGNQPSLILANILASPLVELAPTIQSLPGNSPTADFVLSGILEAQVAEVISAYQPTVNFDTPVVEQGWVRLHGQASPHRLIN